MGAGKGGGAAGWLTGQATIVNSKGLHARPAARIAKLAASYKAEVSVTKGDISVSARSIMGLMMLAASTGTVLQLKVRGADAAEVLQALLQLIADGFGED